MSTSDTGSPGGRSRLTQASTATAHRFPRRPPCGGNTTGYRRFRLSETAVLAPSLSFPNGLNVSLPTDQIVFADDTDGHVRVGHDENAVLTRAGDPAALAAGMRRLVTDHELRIRLIRGGRALVPRFTWAQAAWEHARVYAQGA